MPGLGSEAIGFRAASDPFAAVRRLAKQDPTRRGATGGS